MLSVDNIRDKEDETINKTIKRFALTSIVFALTTCLFYLMAKLFIAAALMGGIAFLFSICFYINKLGYIKQARLMLLVNCNLGILAFSPYVGYDCGIYLFLSIGPLMIFLLFKRSDKKWIYSAIVLNLMTFIIVYLAEEFSLVKPILLDDKIVQISFSLNFIFSLVFSFILVAIFAKNNEEYVDLLMKANDSLLIEKEKLKLELEEKKKSNLMLQQLIKEREVLLSEVHHRVKNNLALVSGLLELETMYGSKKDVETVLKDAKDRIKMIALLHEKLYQHQNFDSINIKHYIDDLMDFIEVSNKNSNKSITITSNFEPISIKMEKALPFSLLLNELISNSFKHAFKERNEGGIRIEFYKKEEGYIFKYCDSGDVFDLQKEIDNKTMGMNLIKAFIGQLDGEFITVNSKETECHIQICFKNVEE